MGDATYLNFVFPVLIGFEEAEMAHFHLIGSSKIYQNFLLKMYTLIVLEQSKMDGGRVIFFFPVLVCFEVTKDSKFSENHVLFS